MSPFRRLLSYVGRHRRSLLLGLVCVVCATTINLTSPWILKLAIDDLLAGVTTAKLRLYGMVILLLAAAGGIFRFLVRRILVGAARDLEADLRDVFFAKLQQLDLDYFTRHRTGDLMSRATNDLNAVRMMIGQAVMYSSTTMLTFVVAIILMFSIDPRLTMIALIPLPFITLTVRYFGAAIHRRFETIQEQFSDISAVTQESLAGVRVIRAYRQEPFEIERFHAANLEYLHRSRTLIRLQRVYDPSIDLLMGVGAILVLWLGSRSVINGRMTVGELVAFNSYLMMLAWPMIAFGWVTNLLQRGMASWKRLLEVLDAEPRVTDLPDAVASGVTDVERIQGAIDVRHLTFSYGGPDVLRDVSFSVPAGTTTASVGATGSGKSTLLNLLPRLYDPPPGTVFIDGVDVRQLPLGVLRGAIGFVPQEPFLFSASLAENVAFGARGVLDTRYGVEAAAAVARLDKDVEDFPHRYETVIGERGITLSGGQKQRAAIARALVVDPKILVLDDALSSVDTHTAEEILHRLAGVMRARTSILVSHRVSTVRGADQILVLDDGRVVERGTHDELVRHDGPYAELYRKQLLEEELKAS